jgi:hypothetical protein
MDPVTILDPFAAAAAPVGCGGSDEPTDRDGAKALPSILPLAMRVEEITEGEAETLRRIAEDKTAPAGRLRRPPKAIPAAEPVTTIH